MTSKMVVLMFMLLISGAAAKDLYSISPIGVTCEILDPTIVANMTCHSKSMNRTTHVGSHEIIYQPGVVLTDSHLKVQVYRKFGTIYRKFLVTLDFDECAMLAGSNSKIFDVLNVNHHRKYGNLYDPCPILGRRYEETHPAEYESFPEILPDGEYRLEVIKYSIIKGKKQNYIRYVAMGVIKPKTAEQWRK